MQIILCLNFKVKEWTTTDGQIIRKHPDIHRYRGFVKTFLMSSFSTIKVAADFVLQCRTTVFYKLRHIFCENLKNKSFFFTLVK